MLLQGAAGASTRRYVAGQLAAFMVLVAAVALVVWDGSRNPSRSHEQPSADLIAREAAVTERKRAVQIAQNEMAALAYMKFLISAQAQARQGAWFDADHDGVGEYAGVFDDGSSVMRRGGYYFKVFLPNARGAGVSGPAGLVAADPDLSETTWCCYAWPVKYGTTGRHAFFTNQAGDVVRTDDSAYSGRNAGPPADAAFREAGSITGDVAIAVPAVDGNTWKTIG